VEEADSATHLAPNYLDMTDPGHGRILEFAPGPGSLLVEFPLGFTPQAGLVLGDTAFGGLLRKVIEVDPQYQAGPTGRIWHLRTLEAGLPDAVLDCDLGFRTRMDFNLALADLAQSQDVQGTLGAPDPVTGDSAPASGHMDIGLKGAQILFQPMVTGRIRVRDGNVEAFDVQVEGDCEVMAQMQASVTGAGDFEFEEELPGKAPQILPLGSGLFVRMQQRPSLRLESHSQDDFFSAQADFRIRNALKGELGYGDGQWRPLAKNKMTWTNNSLSPAVGNGELKLMLKPRVEMLLEGANGPVFTFAPYARLVSARGAFVPGWTRPDPAAPESIAVWAARREIVPGAAGISNREITLGSDIHMESRTTFLGPSDPRDFLLFSGEQSVLAPPKEGTLFLREADSNRVVLQCSTWPKADYYVVQQKLGNGPWETVLDKIPGPRIRLPSLKPGGAYRFRAIGVNAMGYGPAFPPDGAAYLAPIPNHPPFPPLGTFPDSAAVLPDSQPVVLAWKGGDPDPGSRVLYSVFLDTRNPPLALRAGNLSDTSLALSDLKPGATYYWKVAASDGIDRSEGTVRSFTVRAPRPAFPQPAKGFPAYPLAFVPKGSYRREDGKLVQVGPLFMGKYEVTQAEYEKVTGRNPSYRLQDSLPVDRVTWDEADAFCRETGGRLPTEAEWEYAARAGSASAFYWGDGDAKEYAWYRDNSEDRTQKVGLKRPNGWGLYDMAGNVFEWVQDWYGEYDSAEVDHPKGPATGTAKVIRGASWYSEAASLSLSARFNNRPGFRNFKVGFRCARDVERTAGAGWPDPSAALASRPVPAAPK
jgi:formylglycine-generating enzyme required for sulfatase activity